MAYHYQARDMAVLHAVANARPFAQSARGGLSYIIDQNGHYVAQTGERGYKFIEGAVQANTTKTFYTVWGDWVVWVSGAIVLGTWLTSSAMVRMFWATHSRKE
jgi:apolipoprotein N-acyltransferase